MSKASVKKGCIDLGIAIYLFLIIYRPRVLPFSISYITLLISLIGLFYYFFGAPIKEKERICMSDVRRNKGLIGVVFGYLVATAYILFVYLVNGRGLNELSNVLKQLAVLPQVYYVILFMKHRKYRFNDVLRCVFIMVAIQSCFAAIMYVSPYIKDCIMSLIVNNADEAFRVKYEFQKNVRFYGVALNYLYALPVLHGILAAVLLIKAIRIHIGYAVLGGASLVVAFINARIGVVCAIVSIVAVMMYFAKGKQKQWIRLVSGLLLGGGAIVAGLIVLIKKFPSRAVWIKDTLRIFTTLFGAGDGYGQRYYGMFFNSDFLFFPTEVSELFLGIGLRASGTEFVSIYGKSSDIGYVNDIFYGGFVWCLIIYIFYFKMIFADFKKKTVDKKIVAISLGVSMLIANYKGQIWGCNDVVIFMLLINFANYYLEDADENQCRNISTCF